MLLLLGSVLAAPSNAHAVHRDVKSVLTFSAYGLAAGTLVGLASFPLTQNNRSVFVGSSMGLYLGMIVGIYYINHRYDPGNPLHMDHPAPPPWMEKGKGRQGSRAPTPYENVEQPLWQAQVTLTEF